jgi:hypothetical protein
MPKRASSRRSSSTGSTVLVERKTFGRGLAGETAVEITYRFGPPEGEDMLAEK